MLKNYSATDCVSYIESNYLTINQLANQTDISAEQIQALIDHACIPKHSHSITHEVVLQTKIFGATNIAENESFYYHPSLVNFAVKASQYLKSMSYIEVSEKMKSDFFNDLRQALMEVDDVKDVFDYCFDDSNNIIDAGVDKMMNEHWDYVMDGTYGVCLKNISAKNMLIKNISVAILEQWEENNQGTMNNNRRIQISHAADLYDAVSANFGPHDVNKSTRGRLFNKFKKYLEKTAMN